MPTRKITRIGRRAGTGDNQLRPKTTESASLVDLLNALQQNNLDFLPVSPQQGLGLLGRGLSGLVHQSVADTSTMLAFKEGIPSRKTYDTEQDQDWYSLVTEITILQHPSMKANPHIVDLLGLSFSISSHGPTEQSAWPLVVTSKVNRGDLTSVLNDEHSPLLSTDSRMVMFAEFAEALFVLHSCGTTHGDLKTDNILIQTSGDEEMNLLLIDFGSSAILGQTRVPTKSEPWNAPELETTTRSLDHQALVQLDLYSFGLICLHLLLPLSDLASAGLCLIRTRGQTEDQWIRFLANTKQKKAIENLENFSCQIVSAIESAAVPQQTKYILKAITETTIRPPVGERTLPWRQILPHIQRHLSDSYHRDSRLILDPPPLAFSLITTDHSKHRVFNLSSALGDLDDVDYVLPASIYKDLLRKAVNSVCEACRQEYAFLSSVCNIIGFGCCQDFAKSEYWLVKSHRTKQDLGQAVEGMGKYYCHPGRVSSDVLNVFGIGVIVSAERTQQYRISGRLAEAANVLKERIEARESVFGSSHLSLAKPVSDLSQILEAQSHLDEAEACLERASKILDGCLGRHHPSTLATGIHRASLLAQQGLLQNAEQLALDIMPVMERVLGITHPETVTTQMALATIRFSLGNYVEAEQMMVQVARSHAESLSDAHPLTVRAELNLANIMTVQGRLIGARDLLDAVSVKLSGTPASNNLTRSQLSIIQAVLYKDMGLLKLAFEKVEEGLLAMDRLRLPADDTLRLDGLEIQASIFGAAKERLKQEAVLRHVLHLKSGKSDRNQETLKTRRLLAENLLAQFRLDEAWSLTNQVLAVLKHMIDQDPENYMIATGIKAEILTCRGQLNEAEKLRRDLLDHTETILGNDSTFALEAACSLGSLLSDRGEGQKAQALYEQVLSHPSQTNRLGLAMIRAKRLLVGALLQQGHHARAQTECHQGIDWAISTLGSSHEETIALRDTLGDIYLLTEQFAEADRLYSPEFQELSVGTAVEPYVLEHVADLRKRQQRRSEASELKRKSEALLKSTLGKLHPESIRMEGRVLSDSIAEPELFTHAIELKALENIARKKSVLGTKHPSTTKTCSNLAYAYAERGRLDEADKLFQELWDTDRVNAIHDPSERAKVIAKGAYVLFRLRRFKDAEDLERQALEIRLAIYGETHGSVLTSMCNLASTLEARGEYESAEKYLRHVVTVREGNQQPTIQSVHTMLVSRTALGAVLYRRGQMEEATSLYATSIAAAEQIGLPHAVIRVWKADLDVVRMQASSNSVVPSTPVVVFSA